MACSLASIAPALAATLAASLATAVSAGSANVVPNPNENEKITNQNTLPLRANASANDSPMGNKPISKPNTKNVNPKTIKTKPIRIEPSSAGA